ncbi:transglutaminase-like domain-containing protein [Fictibacillus nanhaiensis]|uniref:transglutaminase domain-containing protein n=1 Tax=Fictibacillus nanhaiensis TaxID=742169 RepID=UPI00203F0A42|nr:transglutaminase-like domain-containing protein [Fictibacillus nanhaiensis]MCM3733856.1 transglutaminase-like domain-containing protein [Fictibacillus nanhaiensis]
MNNKLTSILLSFIVLAMTACSADQNGSSSPAKEEKKDKYTALAEEANKDEKLEKLELLPYAEEVEVTLSSPTYKEFKANSTVLIKGKAEKYSGFKSDYVWIKVRSEEDGPVGREFSYYAPIKEGKFEQKVQLFNGKGNYSVKVSVPSETAEDYFYDIAEFDVENVNPEVKRDVALTKNALEHGLVLKNSINGYMERDGSFELEGVVGDTRVEQLMVELKKESESTKIMIPVEDGKFSKKIPLYYGEGVHEVQIMTPKEGMSNYYSEAANLFVKNLSSESFEPINYSSVYKEKGFNLETPEVGGEKADLTYKIKGSINPSGKDANKTDVVFVQTEKDNLKAMYAIPVKNNKFEGEFFLRFGPGEYEVSLMAPDFTLTNGYVQHFVGVAGFTLENTNAKDQRFTLPSRGIQSDAPEIKKLADQLTKNKKTEKEKALAVYEYVAKTVSYDVDKLNNRTFEFDDSALKTLDEKEGVCQDFAYLAIALLRASGMETQMVTGYAGQNHAWVETKVDGRWLTMDPTWGSGYLQNNKFAPKFTMEYFDPKPAEFQKTHTKKEIEF